MKIAFAMEKPGIIFLVIIFCFINVARGNVLGQGEEQPVDNPGLYNESDYVVALNYKTFKPNVHYSDRAWLVEFYNSWCGFCVKFAPIWKAVAKSVHGWRNIVTIAAVDCANDDNNPLCREYEVMSYPTLKFFSIDAKDQNNYGVELKKGSDEMQIIQELIEQLVKEEQEQRSGPAWPNLVPFRGTDLETLWHGTPTKVQYEFLIFEEPKSYLGAQVILDLYKLDIIRIRRVSSENEFLTVTSKVSKFPSVIVLGKDNSRTFLKIDIITRDGIRETIINFLKSKGIPVDIKEDKELVLQESSKLSLTHKNEHESSHFEDKLFQLDLETALRYSLNNEIPLSPRISDEKLKALKDYLKVLSRYFPAHLPKTKTYLQILHEIVESKSNITGGQFKEHVKTKEKGLNPVYSGPKAWVGCKGSTPDKRGYPCGLWTLFHTLTVAAAEEEISNPLYNEEHPSVLIAMHEYIKNFFTCTDCSKHFQEMAARRKIFDVVRDDDSILWLWRAHNEVNERLAGDPTEDPEHKKIQYPTSEHCPRCRLADGKWDEVEVLKYLKTKYSRSKIDLEGINDQLIQHEIDTSVTNSGVSSRKIGWDFTVFDISICVVLYAISSTILILVCIKFAVKRTYKKKLSFNNLFGVA